MVLVGPEQQLVLALVLVGQQLVLVLVLVGQRLVLVEAEHLVLVLLEVEAEPLVLALLVVEAEHPVLVLLVVVQLDWELGWVVHELGQLDWVVRLAVPVLVVVGLALVLLPSSQSSLDLAILEVSLPWLAHW